MKSYEPTPQPSKTLKRWYDGISLLLSLVLFGFLSEFIGGWLSVCAALLSMLAAYGLWHLHLRSSGLPRIWTAALPALLAFQMLLTVLRHLDIRSSIWFAALGCGLFVYALVWVTSMHERNAGLQAIATIALLLTLGVISKPALAMACLLVSFGLFIANRRRFGGLLGSALLFFTPTMLCFAAIALVNFLMAGALFSHLDGNPAQKIMPNSGWPLIFQIAPSLWFAFSVLLARSGERRIGIPDFSFLLTIVFASTAGIASWMPDPLSAADIMLIVYAGTACLLSVAPPQKLPWRLIVLAAACIPLAQRIFF